METQISCIEKVGPTLIDSLTAAQKISESTEQILSTWEEYVRCEVIAARSVTSPILRNSLPRLLVSLVANLRSQNGTVICGDSSEFSRIHGAQRAALSEYSLSQAMAEYRLLRQTIFEILEGEQKVVSPVAKRKILDHLDIAIEQSIAEFAKWRMADVERSNRDLQHFAAIAAHDLKSPLATISSYMELIDQDRSNRRSIEEAKYFQIIRNNAARMILLIDRLLEYSGIARAPMNLEAVSTQEMMSRVTEGLKQVISKAHAQITYRDLPTVYGEPSLLFQLFQNLLSNAVKFRDQQRPCLVQVTATDRQTCWEFCVQDNGIGFSAESKEAIFELFKKMHTQESHMGSGIGLATVRRIVERHGGRVWAESAPGQGASFHFTLEKWN